MVMSRKKLSPAGLLKETYQYFAKKLPEQKKKKRRATATDPSMVDSLMSCLAVFHLKFSSLLQYDEHRRTDLVLLRNLETLYHIENPPSDTTMREKLDGLNPSDVRGVFKKIFSCAQRGKVLEKYEFWNKHYLLSIDGTSQFFSHKVHCENCCVKHHSNGDVSYYHNALAGVIVHPHMKYVLPVAPEPITKQDGATKNDCEQNAAKRLLQDFRREHPHLKVVVNEDSLYSTGPHIQLLKELNMPFIIGAKPGNLGFLFDWVGSLDLEEYSHGDAQGKQHVYKFANHVPLNDTHFETKVNFLEYWETDKKCNVQHFSWITDIPLTKDTVELIMRGGRARWKIENETFSTLKNQGYNFKHNYGHGQNNLCSVMGMLMMLAFFVDQVSELCDTSFQKARKTAKRYLSLWNEMMFRIKYFIFLSWDDLLEGIANKKLPNSG